GCKEKSTTKIETTSSDLLDDEVISHWWISKMRKETNNQRFGMADVNDSVKVKTVNDDVQIRALVDEKKIIVNEASIRYDRRLEDAEVNDDVQIRALVDEKKIIVNEASIRYDRSTMAFAIICLANNQKFNFSKYIFESMVKNLESKNKFWMYPRFVQVFANQQLGDMTHHKKIFVNPSLTKKVFANIKREGKGYSRVVTPLFETIMIQAPKEVGEGVNTPRSDEERLEQHELT
nr:hypothetical protein [Tanacetum cinerariifolium]